jgi:4-carboxymuconolactone decarboxylase
LRPIGEEELTPEQRTLWEAITGGPRAAAHGGAGALLDADGGLLGPFNAWLYSPAVGTPASALGEAVRFGCSFGRRLTEVAIVVAAAHWRSNFEFWAHSRYALDEGVDRRFLDGLAAGDEVEPEADDERVVVRVCRELFTTTRLTDDTYAAAAELLGEAGLVELVTLLGYYTVVALNLNAFRVGLPPGVEAVWPH